MHAKPFLTRPNSPKKLSLHDTPVPLYYVDADPSLQSKPNMSFEDFEFEPHARATDSFCLQQQQQKIMSFADELFHGGQLLPLKLPPRLQAAGSSINCSLPSSCATSPTALSGSLLRSPFGRRGLKIKDIDPFMVALEKVRKEDTARRGREPPGRRARSLSPLRSSTWFREHGIGSFETTKSKCIHMQQVELRKSPAQEIFSRKLDSTNSCEAHRREIKHLLKMSSSDLRAANGGKWKDWIKEVIKQMGKKPLPNWHGSFMCFGHNL